MRKLAVALAVTAFLFVAAPAAAATAHCGCTKGAYPPTTTTTQPPPTSVVYVWPYPIESGATISYEMCGFAPDSVVTLTFNGTRYSSGTVGQDGCITITVRVAGQNVSIDGGPLVPANWSDNTLTVAGTGADYGSRTYTLVFNISGQVATTTTTIATTAAHQSSPSSGSPSAPSSTLAFTGFEALATTVGGLALLAVGASLVYFTRRRRRSEAPIA